MAVIFKKMNKLECLPLSVTSNLVWYLQARLELNSMEPLTGLSPKGWRPGLYLNIMLLWKEVYDIGKQSSLLKYNKIAAVKSFIVQGLGPRGHSFKTF
jgi:hypothetical protein